VTGSDTMMDMLEGLRPELTRYCYRMLGSIFDADDAVQDTIVRAWQHWAEVADEAARRAWLYRIATNVCLDRLRGSKRRAVPMDLSSPSVPLVEPQEMLPGESWVWPAADSVLAPDTMDPAERAVWRSTIRLAFVAALQTLPPRQRAVLIMREAFGWPASDVATMLGTTVTGVNSALQRARATINLKAPRAETLPEPDDQDARALLDRYVRAFEAYDVHALTALFHEDGSISMPPFVMWVQGAGHLRDFYILTQHHCNGSRLLPVTVNATHAAAQYSPGPDGELIPWAIHVPVIREGRLQHVHQFIDPGLYERFGLPTSLPPV
jgi:RNA polymerase sigma-70 factor (TIGR02960 family)